MCVGGGHGLLPLVGLLVDHWLCTIHSHNTFVYHSTALVYHSTALVYNVFMHRGFTYPWYYIGNNNT